MTTSLSFTLNGESVSTTAPLSVRLVDVLRDEFHLMGTKEGCGEGECGACMVLMNGRPTLSCLVLLGAAKEKEIVTIEGLRNAPGFAILAQAFNDAGAVQCGFCTPGMIMTTYALLRDHPEPDETTIRTAMAGNLCRCTGYSMIVEAVSLAAQRRGEAW
ncbi:(2Fe-2S)-binding protein [Pseudodesulfovibrio sp. zrk46]|uniref:(2Fe-2S)-binding protein n=1 Tax=Pseudodesulfovibrio sp. zrk46 TaxID=2725288 RepID=UPI001449EEDB|nr:(2Fe-2S)-binding protein [Pseudodesulfovibrio sp. zrk46]QJB57033.1 (2Fe-2S)-binding protein [Pseudodesulfovibrio sp. zrk46]